MTLYSYYEELINNCEIPEDELKKLIKRFVERIKDMENTKNPVTDKVMEKDSVK